MSNEKVYLAMAEWQYEGSTVLGAYSTRELAQARIDGTKRGDNRYILELDLDSDTVHTGSV